MIGVKEIRDAPASVWRALVWFVPDFLITGYNLCSMTLDWVRLGMSWQGNRSRFAFLVHAPETRNIFTPLPLLRYLPTAWVLEISRRLPPYRIGKLEIQSENGRVLSGDLLTITIAPEHTRRRKKVRKRPWSWKSRGSKPAVSREAIIALIEQAVRLGALRGATLVGLGAYLPSFSRQGVVLKGKGLGASITTGHTCTAIMIAEYVEEVASKVGIDLRREVVAIVGAAGSTGRAVTGILKAQELVQRVLLVDLPHEEVNLQRFATEWGEGACIATDIKSVSKASIIITLTTTPGSIITPEVLGKSAVIIDDSRPRNTDEEVLRPAIKRGQALVIDVLAEVPGLQIDFNYGLDMERPQVTYTCLAEVVALTLMGWQDDFTVGDVRMDQIVLMQKFLEETGIRKAQLTSFNRPVSEEEIDRVRAVRTRRAA